MIEVYCDGSDGNPHERWIVARLEPVNEPEGTLWTVDFGLSSGPQVKQYLHGDVWVPDEPVDMAIEANGPLRLRYSLRCEKCEPRRNLVRSASAIEPVFAKLVQSGVPAVSLPALRKLCC